MALPDERPSVVVGVVGMDHVKGIVENWDGDLDIDDICKWVILGSYSYLFRQLNISWPNVN